MKPKYPHMRQWETQIMDRYHENPKIQAKWSYDVHLSIRMPKEAHRMTPREAQIYMQSIAKRIDAVAETTDTIYVIEVKDRLRPSAIGQALTYKTLYKEQYPTTKNVQPVILTTYTDLDMLHVAEVYHIQVWVV